MAKPTSIFIIDDDPVQLQMLSDHLSSMSNFTIKTFPTGEDALREITSLPDVVFLDYYLNSVVKNAKDGLDILQEIKAASPLTEVVMLSGQDKIDVAVEVMKYGAFDYIVKGESAFYRAEKAVYNLYRMSKLKQSAAMYKTLSIAFGIAFVLMIILVIVLKQKGVITNNPGWMP
jgi:DNA-binding NtrC family response regulator